MKVDVGEEMFQLKKDNRKLSNSGRYVKMAKRIKFGARSAAASHHSVRLDLLARLRSLSTSGSEINVDTSGNVM